MIKLIYICPGCNNNNIDVSLTELQLETHISIMCWDICGMDFDVTPMWFFLNSWRDEDE
jgi:hypothetical protein